MKKLMVMVAALAMITSSAYAADWNFYGSARISTFYTSSETIDTANTDVDGYDQNLQGNARIGANVKVSDELTGRFEYGASDGKANIRLLYGEWNFGAGTLVVGQDYTPNNWFYSDQVYAGDDDLLKHGGVYSGRVGQLKVKIGGFQAALVPAAVSSTGTAATSTEIKLPGLEVGYSMNFDTVALNLGGGYQTYKAMLANGIEESVTSYFLAVGAKADFGPFYIAGNIYGGVNAGNMLAVDTTGDDSWTSNGVANLTTSAVQDNDIFGGIIVAGFVLNDMFKFETGYGYVKEELDVTGSGKNECQSYYLNTTVTLAPGVFFVPEIGVIDGEELGNTDRTYAGVKWQINF